MATTLGGTTIADPMAGADGHRITAHDIGVEMTMADGSLRYEHVGTRKHFALRWQGITGTQKGALWTRYLVKTAQTFVPPEGGSYTVLVVRDSWEEASIEASDATYRYNVALELEEQAAV
jgi:hypothetical protein